MRISIRIQWVGLRQRITLLKQESNAILANGGKRGQPLVGFY